MNECSVFNSQMHQPNNSVRDEDHLKVESLGATNQMHFTKSLNNQIVIKLFLRMEQIMHSTDKIFIVVSQSKERKKNRFSSKSRKKSIPF